ncbi:restriction endonuclease (plasmid) [Macrococcoides canis]|uniref:restriction endonuclease n=1 Tax=Macrococcoides canis TaxID=1855823 RepID=UPI001F1B137B|nr:restriction endonuclease [Macrococcus canis]UJS29005.1 restriction endonuclease [Macrococcus canis]
MFTAQHYYNADGIYIITNSIYTKSVIALADKLDVVLIDRNKLKELERRYIN